jgi:hypothetical protein
MMRTRRRRVIGRVADARDDLKGYAAIGRPTTRVRPFAREKWRERARPPVA